MFLSSLTSLVCHLKNVTFGHQLKHSHSSDNITVMIEGEVQFGLIQTQLRRKEIFLLLLKYWCTRLNVA